jgi:hypothetical protein
MLKRFNMLALSVACGMALCGISFGAGHGFAAVPGSGPAMQQPGAGPQQPTGPGAGPQQQPQQPQQMPPMGDEQPTTPGETTHHQKQSVLTGKIAVKGGQYVFENTDNNSTLTISNPKKAKKYSGDAVKVKGTVNQQAQTIHISKIKPLSS